MISSVSQMKTKLMNVLDSKLSVGEQSLTEDQQHKILASLGIWDKIISYGTKIESILNSITGIDTMLSSHTANISSLNTTTTNHTASINSLNSTTSAHTSSINSINSTLSTKFNISGGTITGNIEFPRPTEDVPSHSILFNGNSDNAMIYYTEPSFADDGRLRIRMADNPDDAIQFVWHLWNGEENPYIKHTFTYYGYTCNGTGSFSSTVSASAFNSTSDRNLKENFEEVSRDISSLKAYSYNFKDDPSKRHIGLIAQDLQNIVPEAVSKDNEDGHLMLDYNAIVALLVNKVNELSEKVQKLESHNIEDS